MATKRTPRTTDATTTTPVDAPSAAPSAAPLPTALITNTLMVSGLTPGAAGHGAPDCDTLLAFVSEGHAHIAATVPSQQVYLVDPTRESDTATQLTASMLDHIIAQVARAASGPHTRICVAETDALVDDVSGIYHYAPVVATFILAALAGLPYEHVLTTYVLPAFGAQVVAPFATTPAQRAVIDTALAARAAFTPIPTDPAPEPASEPASDPAPQTGPVWDEPLEAPVSDPTEPTA